MQALESVAQEARLIPKLRPSGRFQESGNQTIPESSNVPSADMSGWVTFTDLAIWFQKKPDKAPQYGPQIIRDQNGSEIKVSNWASLLKTTADWLVQAGYLASERCPVTVGNMRSRYLIDLHPTHPNGRTFTTKDTTLSNGLHIELHWGAKSAAMRCCELLVEFGQDPAQFHVLLG